MKQGFGYCWATDAAVENRPFFRYYFLEGMVYVMLQSLHLTPIHAACVARGGKGVLLCGGPRAGKSSLAFACARRGWTFVSDDASYLVRSRNDNVVVGNPHVMRFQESAIELFPELKGHPIPPRVNGEVKIELATAGQPGMATAPQASVDYLLFLDRQDSGLPCILPFPKEEAMRWLEQVACYGEKQVRDAQVASLVNLLSAEVFELRYSDLDLVVDLISSLVGDAV
jgi:hypothetical protein